MRDNRKASKWYRLEKAHEIRMWGEHVIFPAIVVGTIALSDKDVRGWLKSKKEKLKERFKRHSEKEEP